MASFIAKTVSKKILGETLQNKFGKEDPYFEHVPATRLDGRPSGKLKRREKALPPGISDQDGQVLTKVKRRAYRLDLALCSFLGIRFGWSSVVALVPIIGDALDACMALMVFKSCCQVEGGLPKLIRLQMILNIILDFAVGLVPFIGDLADAMFKANTRNCLLLERHLREKGRQQLRKSGQPIPAVDPSSPDEFDRLRQEILSELRNDDHQADRGTAPTASWSSRACRMAGLSETFHSRGVSDRLHIQKTKRHDLETGREENTINNG